MPHVPDNDGLSGCPASGDEGATETTRRVVTTLLTARDAKDVTAVTQLLAEDVVFRTPVSEEADPVVGPHEVARSLTDGHASLFLRVETVDRTVHRIIADGEIAVVLQRLRAATHAGGVYDNEYVFVFRVRHGLVDRVWSHADTLTAARSGLLPFPAGK